MLARLLQTESRDALGRRRSARASTRTSRPTRSRPKRATSTCRARGRSSGPTAGRGRCAWRPTSRAPKTRRSGPGARASSRSRTPSSRASRTTCRSSRVRCAAASIRTPPSRSPRRSTTRARRDAWTSRRSCCSRASFYFGQDRACPLAYEPSGEDFFSPCLAEADLMRRVLPPKEYGKWLQRFLPQLSAHKTFPLAPVTVTDPTDPRLVHLDGLNLSRAWMLRGIAAGSAAVRRPARRAPEGRGRARGRGPRARQLRRLRRRALARLVRGVPADREVAVLATERRA